MLELRRTSSSKKRFSISTNQKFSIFEDFESESKNEDSSSDVNLKTNNSNKSASRRKSFEKFTAQSFKFQSSFKLSKNSKNNILLFTIQNVRHKLNFTFFQNQVISSRIKSSRKKNELSIFIAKSEFSKKKKSKKQINKKQYQREFQLFLIDLNENHAKYIKITYFRDTITILYIIKYCSNEIMFEEIEKQNLTKIKILYKVHEKAKKKTTWKNAQKILDHENKRRFINQSREYFLIWLNRFQYDSSKNIEENNFVSRKTFDQKSTFAMSLSSSIHKRKTRFSLSNLFEIFSLSTFERTKLRLSKYQNLSKEDMKRTNNLSMRLQNFKFWKNSISRSFQTIDSREFQNNSTSIKKDVQHYRIMSEQLSQRKSKNMIRFKKIDYNMLQENSNSFNDSFQT